MKIDFNTIMNSTVGTWVPIQSNLTNPKALEDVYEFTESTLKVNHSDGTYEVLEYFIADNRLTIKNKYATMIHLIEFSSSEIFTVLTSTGIKTIFKRC
jgi:hypothetical protein